jgi:3-dehydroquinate synthase
VINDFDFLHTLSARDMRAGIAEAVKVALIKDRKFFDRLYKERRKLAVFEPEAMERMIIRCAELHLEHISLGGDPFECGASRPLDFGHWSAHSIEEISRGSIKHGEAVAIGIALDSLYSYHRGMISELELKKIFATLEDIGFYLYSRALEHMDVERALKGFQEHLGGELTIALLEGIGKKMDVHEIDAGLVKRCVEELALRTKHKEKGHEGSLQPEACKGNT